MQNKFHADTLTEAKELATRLAKFWLSPFCVVYDYLWDGKHDWRISLGRGKQNVVFIAQN